MVYDFESYFNRPSNYLRPRYYPSYYSSYYTPSYGSYLHDRYYYLNSPYSRWPSYASTRAYLPYKPSYEYKYDFPYPYTYRQYSTYPLSKPAAPIYPEAEKYAHTYGLNFDSTTKDIRSSTYRLLKEVRQSSPRAGSVPRFVRAGSVPRFARASSLDPFFDSDDEIYRSKRAVSRTRMMSEEPSYYRSQFY